MSDLFAGASRAADYEESEQPAEAGPAERAMNSAAEGGAGPMTPSAAAPPGPPKAYERPPAEVTEPGPTSAPGPGLPAGYLQGSAGLQEAAAAALIQPGATVRERATWGWRGVLVRASGGLFRVQPGREEVAHLNAQRVIRQSTWRRPVNALVANKSGGVGKTTTSIVLGGVLATVKGGGVGVYEVCDAAGALWKRAEGAPHRGLGELVQVAGQVGSRGELAGYAAPQTSHAHVIGSATDRRVLTGEDVRSVRRLLDVHYEITVADAGNNPRSEPFAAAVDLADVLVIPTLLSSVPVLDALNVLDNVASQGEHGSRLASTAVVVINHDGHPEDSEVVAAARAQLAQLREHVPTVTVLEVPYDAHVRKGGEITLAALSEQSSRAWTQVGAAVVSQLVQNVS